MNQDDRVMLRAVDLSLGYGDRLVLRGVRMEVRTGEFWFLVGPNGEGKTTLLRAVLGLLPPAGGSLWSHPDRAQRKLLGFVPQRCDINPALPTTVKEFVSLGLVGLKRSPLERENDLRWALERVGLESMILRDYSSLSGGQRQRALVARALIRRPSLLILDEATNGMDLSTEDAFLRCVSGLHKGEGLTILFVTHDLGIAMRFGTHAAVFKGGRVTAGPIADTLGPRVLASAYGVPVEVSLEPSGSVCVRVGPPEVAR
jgi:ABC-type Mn2+/Zn2+ transport system ATPase subunit